jgi:hypothetical protein
MYRRLQLLCVLAIATLVACGGDDDDAGGGKDTFLAFAPDFAGFHEWDHAAAGAPDGGLTDDGGFADPPDAEVPPDGGQVVHDPAIPKTLFYKLPSFAGVEDAGVHEFPVGTIIVKETNAGELAERKIFAMVKRGGGYNVSGARNWEWFELENLDAGKVRIRWRGVGPPAGEMYGGDKNGGCNTCHGGAAAANDHVISANLDLSQFLP